MNSKIKFELDEKLFFYLAPFFTCMIEYMFFSESIYASPYKLNLYGLQAKGLAVVLFIFVVMVVCSSLSKLKKTENGDIKFINLKRKLFRSVFLYIWLVVLIFPIIGDYINDRRIFYINLAILSICLFFQYKFIKEIESFEIKK